MFLIFHFLHYNILDNKCCRQKWGMLFFTQIKLVVCLLASAGAIASIEWRRLPSVNDLIEANKMIEKIKNRD